MAKIVVVDSGRPDWDTYFLTLARAVALRAACNRAQHGAVIVSQTQRVVATGYNGAPAGMTHCSDGGCPRGQLSYADLSPRAGGYKDWGSRAFCIAVHAEASATHDAGPRAYGGTIYVTGLPCDECYRLLQSAGIRRAVFLDCDNEVYHQAVSPGTPMPPVSNLGSDQTSQPSCGIGTLPRLTANGAQEEQVPRECQLQKVDAPFEDC